MLIILMRHGIAEDGEPDEARKLTAEGRDRVGLMARMFESLHLIPGAILSSPRQRAVETAEIVAAHFGRGESFRLTAALDMRGTWAEFAELIERERGAYGPDGVVLLVGHQPHLGVMITQSTEGTRLGMDLRKGSCVGIRFEEKIEPRHARMEFYLTSRLARTVLGESVRS